MADGTPGQAALPKTCPAKFSSLAKNLFDNVTGINYKKAWSRSAPRSTRRNRADWLDHNSALPARLRLIRSRQRCRVAV